MSIADALLKRYQEGAVVLFEVTNTKGYGTCRRADAVAFQLWSSKGFMLEGFEFKASRQDLNTELNDPTKWEGVGKYCDKWWLCVEDKKIVELERLPKAWGVMYLCNDSLRVLRPAERLNPEPWPRSFVASLMQRVSDGPRRQMQAEYNRGFERGQEHSNSSLRSGYDRLKMALDEFEAASGIKIDEWSGKHEGEQFKRFCENDGKQERIQQGLSRSCRNVDDIIRQLTGIKMALAEMEFKEAKAGE